MKGLKHPNIVLLETNSFKTFLGYATNGNLVPLLDEIKTRDYHYSLAASMLRTGWGRGEIFSANISVTRTLNIEDFKEKLSDRKKC